MNNIGCTLPSIRKRTICVIHGLNRRQTTLSRIGFSLISVTNMTLMMQQFSQMDQLHFSEPVVNMTSISGANDMEIGTASNVYFVK